ncbi:hypothetical protein [Niallia nealsonii]|uniref:DUF4401 domain-containing protein n=1 Tax=Niallia nealsonii TaxID=115979 RepID=A0A2N0YX18_9BACI|nr:hypothetical protein [Niallia nealsonii]PKG21798.1 hypothetical protein CWS01_20675 [Niallia nealsonii]
MNENRKNIIVKEIMYWKESRMLPEHYCNYLLTLYTEGNQPAEETELMRKSRLSLFLGSLCLSFIPITVFLFYFTELSFILQMGISLIFLTFCIGSIYFLTYKNLGVDIVISATALIFLLASVHIVIKLFPENLMMLNSMLMFHCLIWFIAGRKLQLLYLTISSCVGFILLIGLFFYKIY